MSVPSNTALTYAETGIREDIMDKVMMISPTETPFISTIGKGSCSQVYTEWEIDELADASADNANAEGIDATNDAITPPVRVGNYTQLMDKVAQISSTNQASKAVGGTNTMAYQTAKKGKELKRDIEKMALSLNASVAGNSSGPAARKSAGVGAWLETNTDHGASGSAGGFSGGIVAAPTAGTARALTETIFKNVIADIWAEGGDATLVFANAGQKQKISTFEGIASLTRETGTSKRQASLVGAVDLYISDFGEHRIVADRFMPTNAIYLIDPEFWQMKWLQPINRSPLAKTGHSERMMIAAEGTLCAKNEAASGGAFDLT